MDFKRSWIWQELRRSRWLAEGDLACGRVNGKDRSERCMVWDSSRPGPSLYVRKVALSSKVARRCEKRV